MSNQNLLEEAFKLLSSLSDMDGLPLPMLTAYSNVMINLDWLRCVCKSYSDKECELSQSDKIDSADKGHD